jgi:hypothetical protein
MAMHRNVARLLVGLLFLVASTTADAPCFAQTPTSWGALKAHYAGVGERASQATLVLEDGPIDVDPGDETQYWSSPPDSYNLPIGCSVTEAQLLTWARTMPAVQLAMSTLAGRGYIAHPEADNARRWCSGILGSCVVIAYERPVTVLEEVKLGAGAIIVTSVLDQTTGNAITRISGGMLIIDHAAQTIFAADSLASYMATDPSFDIEVDGGDGSPDPGIIRPGNATVVPADEGLVSQSRFTSVVKCTGGTAFVCAAGIALGTYYGGPGAWAAAVAAGGWGVAAVGVGCLAASYIGCQMVL